MAKRRNTRKRGTRKRGNRNNVGGIPVRKYAKTIATLAAALGSAAMYAATRGPPHDPGRGHTSAAPYKPASNKGSGSKRHKKGSRKTRRKGRRGKSKRR